LKSNIVGNQKTAADIFQLKNLNLALIGPYDDKNRFQKLLEAGL